MLLGRLSEDGSRKVNKRLWFLTHFRSISFPFIPLIFHRKTPICKVCTRSKPGNTPWHKLDVFIMFLLNQQKVQTVSLHTNPCVFFLHQSFARNLWWSVFRIDQLFQQAFSFLIRTCIPFTHFFTLYIFLSHICFHGKQVAISFRSDAHLGYMNLFWICFQPSPTRVSYLNTREWRQRKPTFRHMSNLKKLLFYLKYAKGTGTINSIQYNTVVFSNDSYW